MSSVSTLVVALAAFALFAVPAGAVKTHLFKETFGSAEQPSFGTAAAVAVDQGSGDLLVLDRDNGGSLRRFKVNGEPSPFPALGGNGIDGAKGPGGKPCAEEPASCDEIPQGDFDSFSEGASLLVAIDESGTATDGNIYVADGSVKQIHVFAADGRFLGQLSRFGTKVFGGLSGLAVDLAGNVYVSDIGKAAIHKFDPSANPPTNADFTTDFTAIARPQLLVVGAGPSGGSLFVESDDALFKLKLSNGEFLYPVFEAADKNDRIVAVSVDPSSGHVFVAMQEAFIPNRGHFKGIIREYDAAGVLSAIQVSSTTVFDTPTSFFIVDPRALAVDGGSSEVYALAPTRVEVFDAPIVTQPDVATFPATAITPSKATLNGTVNPDGQILTECFFEYGSVPISTPIVYDKTVPCAEPLAAIGTGSSPVAVHADLTGLSPNQRSSNNFRLVAGNANGVAVFGANSAFETTHTAVTEPATAIAGAGATLNGTVHPNGSAVGECAFDYLPQADFASQAQNEKQTVTLTGATGGTFRLSFEGNETADIPFNASEKTVADALAALHSVGHFGAIQISSGVGGPYTATFGGYRFLATNVPELTADASSLTPPGTTVTVATVNDGSGWEGAIAVPCSESEAEIGTGTSPVPVHADVSGLDTGAEYRFRLRAANVTDGLERAIALNFTTLDTVETKPAMQIGGSVATLNGTVDPASVAVGECTFEYGTSTAYGQSVPCAESEAEIGTGTDPVPVHADVSGLSPNTTYHFRLVAGPAGAATPGGDEELTTRGPGVEAQWASTVATTEAILKAQINPGGSSTTYRLEWGASGAPYASSTPESGSIGADESAHAITVPITGLQADTTYHYRFVTTSNCNPLEAAEVCVFEGPDQTFHTYPLPSSLDTGCPNQAFRTGASAKLPDCRAYEMVSPLDKNNGNVAAGLPSENGPNLPQAAADGERMAFSSQTSFAGPAGASLVSQYVASRSAAGWSTENISAPRDTVSLYGLAGSTDIPYKGYTADLCSGWILHSSGVALAPGAPAEVPNLYRRDICGGGGFELLSSAVPPGFDLMPFDSDYFPDPMGFSTDGSRSVFRANAALTPDANSPLPPGSDLKQEVLQIYIAFDGGKLRLVSVLPDGSAAPTNSTVGTAVSVKGAFRQDSVYHSVSGDGSRVFWSTDDTAEGEPPKNGKLYVRLNATEPQSSLGGGGECLEATRACTIAVSEDPDSVFWGADVEGKTAIYTVAGSGAGKNYDELYEFDVESEASNLIGKGVEGVMGASEDASRIYFASSEVLAAGAVAGASNLYLYQRGEGFDFVATLASSEVTRGESGASAPKPIALRPVYRTSRVSPDGLHAAFTSTRSLTGYDNTDASSGRLDAEVFLYDAGANGGAGELICASCNPSGARPMGRLVSAGVDGPDDDLWAAGRISGWYTQFDPTRSLSDDGDRLFFDSFDALLPGDTNGKADIYQWEALGSGDCTQGSPAYFEANAGCLSLISSGQSPRDSVFFDASASGDDVFFATQSSLLPQDIGLTDVYDARAGGGFPQPPPPPPPCIADACQSVPAPPNDPTPASAGFRGAGDPGPKAKKRACPQGKRKVMRRGKARCVAKRNGKRASAGRRAQREKGRAGR